MAVVEAGTDGAAVLERGPDAAAVELDREASGSALVPPPSHAATATTAQMVEAVYTNRRSRTGPPAAVSN